MPKNTYIIAFVLLFSLVNAVSLNISLPNGAITFHKIPVVVNYSDANKIINFRVSLKGPGLPTPVKFLDVASPQNFTIDSLGFLPGEYLLDVSLLDDHGESAYQKVKFKIVSCNPCSSQCISQTNYICKNNIAIPVSSPQNISSLSGECPGTCMFALQAQKNNCSAVSGKCDKGKNCYSCSKCYGKICKDLNNISFVNSQCEPTEGWGCKFGCLPSADAKCNSNIPLVEFSLTHLSTNSTFYFHTFENGALDRDPFDGKSELIFISPKTQLDDSGAFVLDEHNSPFFKKFYINGSSEKEVIAFQGDANWDEKRSEEYVDDLNIYYSVVFTPPLRLCNSYEKRCRREEIFQSMPTIKFLGENWSLHYMSVKDKEVILWKESLRKDMKIGDVVPLTRDSKLKLENMLPDEQAQFRIIDKNGRTLRLFSLGKGDVSKGSSIILLNSLNSSSARVTVYSNELVLKDGSAIAHNPNYYAALFFSDYNKDGYDDSLSSIRIYTKKNEMRQRDILPILPSTSSFILSFKALPKICNCPSTYEPVCGYDGNTYKNKCFAECANAKIRYSGKCAWDISSLPSETTHFSQTLHFSKGRNLFSISLLPSEPIYVSELPSCITKVYTLASNNTYTTLKKSDELKAGVGYWFNSSGECSFSYNGTLFPLSSVALRKGWNLIGISNGVVNVHNNIGNCWIEEGPLQYDTESGEFSKVDNLVPVSAYFIKVKNNCSFGAPIPAPFMSNVSGLNNLECYITQLIPEGKCKLKGRDYLNCPDGKKLVGLDQLGCNVVWQGAVAHCEITGEEALKCVSLS